MTEQTKPTLRAADLLVEVGCEELPPKSLDELREAFFEGVRAGLEKSNITFERSGSRSFSTPRRLAVLFRNVAVTQPDEVLERRGPAVSAAFDANGEPTPAAQGFARSVGRDVSDLERVATEKGEWLYAKQLQPGRPLDELVYPLLEQALRQLPVPRPMRWADNDFSFVRPVHWLVLLHGERVIDGELLGQAAGRGSRGHRIHSPGPHEIPAADDYVGILEKAFVIAEPERRRERIREQLHATDADVLVDSALLDEVNNLVEWPTAIACSFDEDFLEVPHEALIASMQDHQKFFPVGDANNAGRVSNRFVAIANIESRDVEAVREGYERVIRPRLADARFFLEQDQKHPLDEWLSMLDRVVFQQKIGTVGDKSRRVSEISQKLAELLSQDQTHALRAALLCKCDLMSQMVGEFPELQGVMGRYYARSSDEPEAVAAAIGEHYAPRFSGDAIPESPVGRIVSIADRADTLVGIFAAGLRPTGNKDPFALRRAALGLVRILLEADIELSLNRLLALAANELSGQVTVDPALMVDIREFIVERLRHYYREQGFGTELVHAALQSEWDTLPDLERRLKALDAFMGQEAANSLAAANKRIGNILRKAEEGSLPEIDADLFKSRYERGLFDEIIRQESVVDPLMQQGDYEASLASLATLREPVDEFFDEVMVMDEDSSLRRNRLALLSRLKQLFDQIADLSILG